MSYKKYTKCTLIFFLVAMIIIGGFVYVIDPYFHYHKPFFSYFKLDNQRYQNDGIAKNFDYDAIITGTSMTENFKTSEFDELFNVKSVKMSFSGGSFKEINENLSVALNSHKDMKIVIRCLDLYFLANDYNETSYEDSLYPYYLYDNDYFNDVNYVYNKQIIIESINNLISIIKKEKNTTFDEYSSWNHLFYYNKKSVDDRYDRPSKSNIHDITEQDINRIKDNITINVIELAKQYPDVDFYCFYPPYSIYYWDKQNQEGNVNRQIDIIEYATELLLNVPNIHLFSFIGEDKIVTNLNNYKDYEHYSGDINSLILQKMKNNEDILTINNYKDYFSKIRKFYLNYNYEQYFK